jgi:hypothetical protein
VSRLGIYFGSGFQPESVQFTQAGRMAFSLTVNEDNAMTKLTGTQGTLQNEDELTLARIEQVAADLNGDAEKRQLALRLLSIEASAKRDVATGNSMPAGMNAGDSDAVENPSGAVSRVLDWIIDTLHKIMLFILFLLGLALVIYGLCLLMLPSLTDWWLLNTDISRESIVINPKTNILIGLLGIFFPVIEFCGSRTKRKEKGQSGRD